MRITATNWKMVSRLLDQALDHEPAARLSWVESLPPEYAEAREILRELFTLCEGVEMADLLPHFPHHVLAETPDSENVPSQLGPYRVLERLGEGSMGDVYLAEQQAPMCRRVALKILKFGLSTYEVIGRFELERQTLALMTHPHIARIFDAGATNDGRPYFAMEYVPGAPLTQYCDEHKLDIDARLGLFGHVCSGVQHAHLRGIIHRDLKPSNVLVTEIDGQPVPKIIDFGIAKAATVAGANSDARTARGHILGTPEYMSPEQAQLSPLDIDLRTDVYSLGVLLYELLTGLRPYAVTRDVITPAVLAQEILTRDAAHPSALVADRSVEARERAENRCLSARALAARLRGDLDWITLKALEKDRHRRYASTADLAADIERHTRHEAVLAGPPSAVYRVRKLARRHRIAATTLAALFVTAIVFGSAMAWLAQQTARERDRANYEALVARRVTAFTAGLFELANPAVLGSSDVTARELLDSGVTRLQTELRNERQDVRAALLEAAGNAYRGLGAYDKAERALKTAVELRVAESIREPAAHAQALLNMALVKRDQGDFAAAEQLARHAAHSLERPTDARAKQRALLELIEILRLRSQLHEAAQVAETSMSADERSGEILTTEYARAMGLLGRIRIAQGRLGEGEQLLTRSVALHRQIDGNLAGATIEARSGLADALVVMGEAARAEPILRELVKNLQAIYGERHPAVGVAWSDLGNALSDIRASFDESEQVYLKALDILLERNGPAHPEVATIYNNLGAAYLKLKEWRKADAAYEKAVALRLATLGPTHPDTAATKTGRALALNKLERYAQAETLLREAIAVLAEELGSDHWRTANTQHYLGVVLMNQQRFEDAEQEMRRAYNIQLKALGSRHPRTKATQQSLKELEQARTRHRRSRARVAGEVAPSA